MTIETKYKIYDTVSNVIWWLTEEDQYGDSRLSIFVAMIVFCACLGAILAMPGW